jgi:hypothetical protein
MVTELAFQPVGSLPDQDSSTNNGGIELEQVRKRACKDSIRSDFCPKNAAGSQPNYVGEIAFMTKELQTLLPLPQAPARALNERCLELHCKWSIHPMCERIVIADFRMCDTVPYPDRHFLAELVQRDDIVVLAKGVLPNSFRKEFVLQQISAQFQKV